MNIESYLPESGFNTNECVKSRIASIDIFAIPSASMYMFFDGMDTSLIAKKENSIIKYQISEKIDINNLFLPPLEHNIDPSNFINEQMVRLYIDVTNRCNLNCQFCYVDQSLPDNPIQNIKDKIYKHLNNIAIDEFLEIRFFGGEPLLEYEKMKALIEFSEKLARETNKQVQFFVSTNGLLLTMEKLEYLNAHNVKLKITLRHPDDVIKMGEASTDTLALHNFLLNTKKSSLENIWLGITVDPIQVNLKRDFLYAVEVLGINNISWQFAVDENMQYDEKTIAKLKEYISFIAEIWNFSMKNGKPINIDNFTRVFSGMFNNFASSCVTGVRSALLASNNKYYFCQRFKNLAAFELSNENNSSHIKSYSTFGTANKNPVCEQCWAKKFCYHGCYYRNYIYNKDMLMPYQPICEINKYTYEQGFYVFYDNFHLFKNNNLQQYVGSVKRRK